LRSSAAQQAHFRAFRGVTFGVTHFQLIVRLNRIIVMARLFESLSRDPSQRATAPRIAPYRSTNSIRTPDRKKRVRRQRRAAAMAIARRGATHASRGWPRKATQGLRVAGTAQRNAPSDQRGARRAAPSNPSAGTNPHFLARPQMSAKRGTPSSQDRRSGHAGTLRHPKMCPYPQVIFFRSSSNPR